MVKGLLRAAGTLNDDLAILIGRVSERVSSSSTPQVPHGVEENLTCGIVASDCHVMGRWPKGETQIEQLIANKQLRTLSIF